MSLRSLIAESWKPPAVLPVSEWADRYRQLSFGSEPGQWRTDRTPYLKGVMDVLQEPGIDTAVLMFSAQSGKTEALLNILGKAIHLSPCPILLLQPTLEMAESFSKERLAPMLRDTPVLSDKVRDPRSRDSNNTLLHKVFTGGYLALAGANSPASLASRPIQLLLCDEIDRYPISAGTEGDPVSIAVRRTATFWNRFIIMVSTPTIAGASRIETAFENSDKRLCFVPCPLCGHEQVLDWVQVEYPGKGTEFAEPEGIKYRCVGCGELLGEVAKFEMIARHQWRKTGKEGTVAGFHLNALYSPWQSWRSMAEDFERSRKDDMLLRVWWNTMLGLPWQGDAGDGLEWEMLLARSASSPYRRGEVPERVVFLTAGVDVQGDRLAVAIWGWAEESWLIDYAEILGDPLTDRPWEILESFLGQERRGLRVRLACVDTGYLTQDVYAQVRRRKLWYAIKGKAGDRAIVSRPSWQEFNYRGKVVQRGVQLYTIGVDKAKELLYSRTKIERGDRFINLPQGLERDWCEGFCSEVQVSKMVAGQTVWRWEKLQGVANEPLDTAIYALAAAELCGYSRLDWDRERLKGTKKPTEEEERPQQWVKRGKGKWV